MKKLLSLLLLLVGISSNAMETEKQSHKKSVVTRKKTKSFAHQTREDEIEERQLCTDQFAKRLGRIVAKNGFNNTHKKTLSQIQGTLQQTNVADDTAFKLVVKTVENTCFLLKTKIPTAEEIYIEQLLLMAKLMVLKQSINFRAEETLAPRKKHSTKKTPLTPTIDQVPMPIIIRQCSVPAAKNIFSHKSETPLEDELAESDEKGKGNESDY